MKTMRYLAACAGVVLLLVVAAGPAGAQDTTPGEFLGGYDVQSSALAFSFQPVFPALLPTGDAPVEGTIALTTGRVKSGGNAFGRAALVWPGSAAADPGPLLGAGFGQEEIGALFPKWPVQAQASQGDGEVVTGLPPGLSMRARGFPDRGAGDARIADLDVPGLAHIEQIASTSDSVVKDSAVSSLARVTLQGVSLIGGHITMEEIRSVSQTTSNGRSSTTVGDADIVGMKIGGTEVSVTDEGFKVTGLPPDAQGGPGTQGEPFPGQSPEEYVQSVLENIGARITLFRGVGRKSGGRAQHYELGVVVSIDNPVGGQGPIPPGRFDLILASTTSSSLATAPFAAGDVGGGGAFTSTSGASGAPSISIGGGPEVGGATASTVGERLSGAAGGSTESAAAFGEELSDVVPQRSDYRFGGLPIGMVIGLLLAAALAARYIRNHFASIISVNGGVSRSEEE